MKDRKIFDEVNEKIGRIQQRFRVDLNENYNHNSVDVLEKDEYSWISADHIAKGVRVKKVDNFKNTSILSAPSGTVISNHSHEENEFCVCLSGKIKILTDQDEIEYLEATNGICIKPNCFHSIEFIENSQVLFSWLPKL